MKKYFLLATAALTLAACNNNETPDNEQLVEVRISAGISTPGARAAGDVWEADAIGVMVTDAPNSTMEDLYKNVQYTTASTTAGAADFTAASTGIYFQDATETVTFAAYAPYDATGGKMTGSTAAQADRDAQKAIDYIYTSGATASKGSPTVTFQGANAFAHKMARLIITVQAGTDVTAADVAGGKYSLGGLKHDGTFDVTNGTAEATGTATADWSLSDNSLKAASDVTFTSILYPQTLGSALTFTATIDGQTYTNSTSITPSALAAGTSYTYTITVNKTGLTVSGCTITNWTTGTGGSGSAEM